MIRPNAIRNNTATVTISTGTDTTASTSIITIPS